MERKFNSIIGSFIVIAFIFSILPTVNASSNGGTNIPFYIQTSAGIERATSDVLADILHNHKFEIKKMTQVVQDQSCSIRAEGTSLNVGERAFNIRNKLNFYIPLKNAAPGQGTLTGQVDKSRFDLKFEVRQILETNSQRLVFNASGDVRLDKTSIHYDQIIVTLNKETNKVSISGTGNPNFDAQNLDIYFEDGCNGQVTTFYLITIINHLETPRTDKEIKEVLDQNPELRDDYENLATTSFVATVPEFGPIAGIATILASVGLFFFIRRK